MLLKHAILLAPAPATTVELSGSEAAEPAVSEGWMTGLREEAKPREEPAPTTTKGKEPDGKADADAGAVKPSGNGVADKPASSAPAEKPADNPTDKPVDKSPAVGADVKDQAAYEAELDAKAWPKDKSDWEKHKDAHKEKMRGLRTENQTLAKTLTETQAKIAEFETRLQAKPPVDPDVDKKVKFLEAKNAEYHNALLEAGVELHPDFKAHYQTRIGDIITDAQASVPTEKAEQLKKLLEMPENDYKRAQFDEFMLDLDEHAKTEIYVAMRDLRKIGKEREGEIKKAKDTAQTFAQERTARTEARRAGQEQAFLDTVKVVQDPSKGMVVYQKRDGDDAWNAGVDKRVAEAKAMAFEAKLTPAQVARAALDAKALPVVLDAYRTDMAAWNEEKAKLEAQVASLTATQPGASGSGSRAPGGEAESWMDKKDIPPHERVKHWAADMVKLGRTPVEHER